MEYVCDICGKEFSRKDSLQRHLKNVHNVEVGVTPPPLSKNTQNSAKLSTAKLNKNAQFYPISRKNEHFTPPATTTTTPPQDTRSYTDEEVETYLDESKKEKLELTSERNKLKNKIDEFQENGCSIPHCPKCDTLLIPELYNDEFHYTCLECGFVDYEDELCKNKCCKTGMELLLAMRGIEFDEE
jgi:hypothetical protein